MSPDLLSSISGILLSLAFSYIPGLSEAYASLSGIYKRLIMLALLLVTAAAIYGLTCLGLADPISCDQSGALEMLRTFIAAMIANQSTYALTPASAALKNMNHQGHKGF